MRSHILLGAAAILAVQATELVRWWEESHFAERVLNAKAFGRTFAQVEALLPGLEAAGYTVLNFDWPVMAGPSALYGGFGASDFLQVDPALGTLAEWKSLLSAAHERGLKVVSWFNPSYFWTGSEDFKQAERDVKQYGVGSALPASSPARWFRWKSSCSSIHKKPSDGNPGSYESDRWVRDADAGGACYYSAWSDQPSGDFAKPEWRTQITKIFKFWAGTGLDGFMLDYPQEYLSSSSGCAADVRATIVDPMHELGVAVFGEVYELTQPALRAVLDATKDTFFDSQATSIVAAGIGGSVEAGLTVRDSLVASGQVPRVNPELYSSQNKATRELAAAVAVLLGGYVVNAGSDYGDFTTWAGEGDLAPLLRLAASQPALRPRASRSALAISGGAGGYACVRRAPASAVEASAETVAVIVLNLASTSAELTVDLRRSGLVLPQTPRDLLSGAAAAPMPASGAWTVTVPARGYAVYAAKAGAAPPTPAPASWTKHGGANCYDGAGATSLDTQSLGQFSIAECQTICERTSGCTGVTVGQATYNEGHDCFRRADVVIGRCEQSTEYDTYTMSSSDSVWQTLV